MKVFSFVLVVSALFSSTANAELFSAEIDQKENRVLDTYKKVLLLEGGSNFRDLGGYVTSDGRTVRKGLLFRSGVMTNLTEEDQKYLSDFDFDTIVDLRSIEERNLFPNLWARNSGINYISIDYHFTEMIPQVSEESNTRDSTMERLYRKIPDNLKPQLKAYFSQAIAGNTPLVVNCSAGQDRTGVAAALMLISLGVPRSQVVQDYVLSTEYRQPAVENGSINLAEKAEDNPFAEILLRYSNKESTKPKPLINEEGIPYLYYTLREIEERYSSVLAYLELELDVDSDSLEKLKSLYLI
ncbi:tyrosine-protein phosphatase [Parahaliea mediterranea]|uniref:tyrosine-protein phosphatase n=1 Tax=Parahaliea mediterranea TaxID=651086 RepID=UPI0013002B63|nr:tyrosine-protein phosphatase [Parahaliea mediterranea]